jgi:hypothetical protein
MIYYPQVSKRNAIEYPVTQIKHWIEVDGKTQQWIADELAATLDPRVTAKLIYKVCKKHDIHCQRTGPRSGDGHPDWKGGRIVNKDGYIEVYSPEHPNRRKHTPYVLEHRLVMENHLGRLLTKQEVVHHRNGVKDDNRIENLELFSTNGKHLSETLKGQCPQWTPDGIRRIKEGQQTKRLLRLERLEKLRQLSDGMNQMCGRDGCWSSEKVRRLIIQLEISLEQAYEMGPEPLLELVGP